LNEIVNAVRLVIPRSVAIAPAGLVKLLRIGGYAIGLPYWRSALIAHAPND